MSCNARLVAGWFAHRFCYDFGVYLYRLHATWTIFGHWVDEFGMVWDAGSGSAQCRRMLKVERNVLPETVLGVNSKELP